MTLRTRLRSHLRSILGASVSISASLVFSLDTLGQGLQLTPTTGTRSAPAYPGARGGEAIARVLFGEFNHQGRQQFA
jgi:hypothetical protein